MRGLIKTELSYPDLWGGCVYAFCPSVDRSRSTFVSDFSPQKNNGTFGPTTQAPTWSISRYVSLDFASASNQYVDIPVRDTFQGAATLAAWINPRTLGASSAGRVMVCSGLSLGVTASNLLRSSNDGSTFLNSTGAITLGVWSHVAVVRAAGSTVVEWFINGSSAGTATLSAVGNINENTIGNFKGLSYARGFDGLIDDGRFYSRAVTAQELKTLSFRRGIAYETKRQSRAKAASTPPASTNRNNMLVGCGF